MSHPTSLREEEAGAEEAKAEEGEEAVEAMLPMELLPRSLLKEVPEEKDPHSTL